jgi:putative membrane protein
MNRTTSTLLSIGVSAVLIAVGVWFLYNHSFGVWPGHGRWAMGHHGMMGGGMGIGMIIFWIILIVAVVLLFSGAVNGVRGKKQKREDALNPLEILNQRYARGEIDKVEYEEKRRNLLL